MSDLQAQIQAELEAARAICEQKGIDSPECAVAYDTVEELQAEAAHQRQAQTPKTSFEQYCDANPDAAECRVYDD
ncbi:MAG: Calvin cycle protein CP12 [Gloeomargarita sp. SKYG116]|nr:Calvin cycle protein CP12 [Gloeomargarita sp. SKYG116]MCS7225965.1 Calvin cycle protein CP12 [Gloeomargarita sp. SKYB31]MDW8400113.1 Calvin cycle protein CP12 [Gloeomargarita sp. SKYGB_i_bin116]